MLMPICGKQQVSRFFPGETIFEEGQSGSVIYYIVDGSVELSILRGNKRIVIDNLSSGSYFGDLSALLDAPRRMTVTASRYTEVLVMSQRELKQLLESSPVKIRELLLEKTKQLYHAVNWVEQSQQSVDPFLTAAEIIELHGNNRYSDNYQCSILDYEKIIASISRISGLLPGQVKHLIRCMEEFNLVQCYGDGSAKKIHVNLPGIVQRAKKIVKRIGHPFQNQLRAEGECLGLNQIMELVDADRDILLEKISTGELPDDILLFRKSAVLELIRKEGKDVFKKRKQKHISEWDCVGDLVFASNPVLQDFVVNREPYEIAVLINVLDDNTAERILKLVSSRRRKILESMTAELESVDSMEAESIGQGVIMEIKQKLLTE